MAGSSDAPDRLANQYILRGCAPTPMKLLDRVLQDLREGVEPGVALEPHRGKTTGLRLYTGQRAAAEHAHHPKACAYAMFRPGATRDGAASVWSADVRTPCINQLPLYRRGTPICR